MDKNQGYEIIQTVMLENGRGFALGHHPTAPSPYVTWACYDAAEGLLTSVILILAEFLPPDKEHPQERRHIVSVFKLVQDLLEPSKVKGKGHFKLLMGKLPPDHKARWFAGAALNSAEQAMEIGRAHV